MGSPTTTTAAGLGTTPRRGRPPGYDRDAVTAAALDVLWRKGYEATTVSDLVEATGLSPSSLYGAFGSKSGVMEAALARYDRDRDALLAPLEHGEHGLTDIRRFLAAVRDSMTTADAVGCFMVSTTAGAAAHDPVLAQRTSAYRARVRDGLCAALQRAAALGELSHATSRVLRRRALTLQAALYGAHVARRAGEAAEAAETVDALEHLIQQWGAGR